MIKYMTKYYKLKKKKSMEYKINHKEDEELK